MRSIFLVASVFAGASAEELARPLPGEGIASALLRATSDAHLDVLLLANDDRTPCGGGRFVNSQIQEDVFSFNEKVHGITGSWEEGCKACGQKLQLQGTILPGWYCKKSWNYGIWLKRDGQGEDKNCGTYNDNNLHVALLPTETFDAKVMGINTGSWEDGCDICGRHLEAQGDINPGWYCEKNLNYGIWLKRAWPVLLHNAEWKKEMAGSVPPYGDWRDVHRDRLNFALTTKISNWKLNSNGVGSLESWPNLIDAIDGLNIKVGAETKIMIFGFTNDRTFYDENNWVQEYGQSGFEGNLLALDWSKWNAKEMVGGLNEVNRPFYYNSSCENDRTLGLIMAGFLTDLMDRYSIEPSQVHCIGHSLGAHMCGYIGRTLKASGRILDRISGIDPAGPNWTGERDRLTKNDASFVDVIHTNGGIKPRVFTYLEPRLSFDILLGNLEPSGHVDFYINGGEYQPSDFCGRLGGCSHAMSNKYFAYSINNDFMGSLCWESTVEKCLDEGTATYAPGGLPRGLADEDQEKRVPIGERATDDPTVLSIPWSSALNITTRAYFVFVKQNQNQEIQNVMPLPLFKNETSCNISGIWHLPLDMPGQEPGQERSVGNPEQCQQRCRDTAGCNYFNNFPDGGCHISTGADGTSPVGGPGGGNLTKVAGSIMCWATVWDAAAQMQLEWKVNSGAVKTSPGVPHLRPARQ